MNTNKDPELKTEPQPNYETREEYVKALSTWVNEARLWQNVTSCFPYYLFLSQILQNNNNAESSSTSNQVPAANNENGNGPNVEQNQQRGTPVIVLNENEGFQFTIPPIWKRMLAEGVDFLILFILKLILTLIALEVMDTSNWQTLKEDLMTNITELHVGAEITSSILLMEGIHRIIVCVYEVYWLRGTNESRFGCATPGKALLGITVVSAAKIKLVNDVNNHTVLVYPANNLGFLNAITRSFIKNFILAIMFPFCFLFFVFSFNRTGYDVICNTLVVEFDPNPPKRNFL